MKFNTVAAAMSAALLAGSAHAEDTEEKSSAVVPELPTFTVSFGNPRGNSVPRNNQSPLHARLAFFSLEAMHFLTPIFVADYSQGPVPRAVHRRLGQAMEAFPRQEGHDRL